MWAHKFMTMSQVNRKNVLFLFTILFLFASLAITFHHHDDGGRHFECSLCVATNSISSGNLEIHESLVLYPTTTNFSQPEEFFRQALSKYHSYSDRAPPVSVFA